MSDNRTLSTSFTVGQAHGLRRSLGRAGLIVSFALLVACGRADQILGRCTGPLGKTCSEYVGRDNAKNALTAQTLCITGGFGSWEESVGCDAADSVGECETPIVDDETGREVMTVTTYWYTPNLEVVCDADPSPADPDPDDPDPVEPEPADPAPSNPEPVDPNPVDPEPSDPTPVDPDSLWDGETLVESHDAFTWVTFTRDILVIEPDAGEHPVFIYTVGTFEDHQSSATRTILERMASLGFVAASVNYDNVWVSVDCERLHYKANRIFEQVAASATGTLCAREHADCSKGIVTAGLSQGSRLATIAADYDSRVRATVALGMGVSSGGSDLSGCVLPDARVLPNENYLVITGDRDSVWGSTPDEIRTQLESLQGGECTATTSTPNSCLRDNGSGWILVDSDWTTDGWADHCYLAQGTGDGNTCGTVYPDGDLDPVWELGTDPWTLGGWTTWLDRFVEHDAVRP